MYTPPAWARALFRLGLFAYPATFRRRWGEGMREAFYDAWAEAHARGGHRAALFTVRTALNLIRTGLGERLTQAADPQVRRARRREASSMDHLGHDLRYAIRTLRRRPGFTAVAVSTLALGVGANTAIFSVIDGVLLTPLPYDRPDELITVWRAHETRPEAKDPMSKPDIDDVAATAAFERLVGWMEADVALTGMGEAEVVDGARVTGGLLEVFGLRPHLGRDLHVDEAEAGPSDVVVVGHGFWTQRLGSDPSAVGGTLQLDGRSHEIVGVAPAGFDYPEGARLWRPADGCGRGCYDLRAIGRLAGAASLESAEAEVGALAARLEQLYPDSNHEKLFNLVPLEEHVVGDVRTGLWVLLGAVGIVLLVACANVANLLLVRAQARTGEIALRVAVGASRGRLIGQVMVESLVLAFAGGAAGVALAFYAVEGLVALAPADVPRLDQVAVDGSVLAFALGLVLTVALLFGLAPALRLARSSIADRLGAASGRRAGDRAEVRSRNALLACEVALSVTLLVGAGLLLDSFARMSAIEPGYETRRVVRFTLSLPEDRYGDLDEIAAFAGALEGGIRTIPGVEAVGSIRAAPLGGSNLIGRVLVEGRPDPPPEDETFAGLRPSTHEYLETMRIPVLRGRGLDASDGRGAPPVAVVNERFVEENFPGQEILGARVGITIDFGYGSPYFTVVGVVADVLSSSLTGDARAELYVPLAQMGPGYFTVNVRSTPGAPPVLPEVRSRVSALDSDLPLRDVETMEEVVRRELASGRFYLTLVGLFAALALALAAVGLYGVVSYLVARRTREIGVRMAMGAGRRSIAGLVLGQGIRPAALGLGAGLSIAYAGSRLLESLLYQVDPTDPSIFGGVAVLLVSVLIAATLLPARSATRVDPVEALRAE